MADNSLFALNSPAGRKTFILNTILLGVIALLSFKTINLYIKPNNINPNYVPIIALSEAALYLFFFVILSSLFERRIFDITGERRSLLYKIPVLLVYIAIFVHPYILACQNNLFSLRVTSNVQNIIVLSNFSDMILLVIFVFLCVIPGKFTH